MAPKDLARVYRANSILTATPGQLVILLYDGALGAIAAAKDAFALPARDLRKYEIINRQVHKAQRIIAELRGTLNFEVGGEFAPMMFRLYDYYNRRLLEANLRKDIEPLIEVERLLGELRTAWADMVRKHGGSQPAPISATPVLEAVGSR